MMRASESPAAAHSSPAERRRIAAPRAGQLAWRFALFAVVAVSAVGEPLLVSVSPRPATILSAFFPLVCAGFVCELTRKPVTGSVAILIGAVHATFFAAGSLSLYARHNTSPFLGGASVSDERLYSLVSQFSVIGAVLVCSLVIGGRPESPTAPRVLLARDERFAAAFSKCLVLLSLMGLALTVFANGGPAATSIIGRSHEGNLSSSAVGYFGYTLWAVFSVPAAVLVSSGLWSSSEKRHSRALGLLTLAIIISSMIYFFGSRLNVTLAVLGILLYRSLRLSRPLAQWHIAFGLAVFVLISTPVLAARADVKGNIAETGVGDVLSYGIVDVAVASSYVQPSISSSERNPERYSVLIRSVLPGVGSTASEIQMARLDRIVARRIVIGGAASDSALPPSLPVALWLSWGLGVGMLLAGLLGLLVGRVFSIFSSRGNIVGDLMAVIIAVDLANLYKGGDFILDLTSGLRQILELSIVGVFAWFATRRIGDRDERKVAG